ncbi:hypothetical protein [Parasitella parasitica]|uniref:Uncharacterized protein n=1 Tax=Parasitella parasitica TaxID=35722 RepID=A0A0B7NSV9_9FUNG|nr:hypothetical protein [Parasitella parasitica]
MVDNKQRNITLKKLARWGPSSSVPSQASASKTQTIPPLSNDAPFVNIHHDNLQQGSLYIIKIKQVSLALFEGSEMEPLRWSEARQLPGDFDIYNAFDECGNPPIHLWSRYLRVGVPSNWFSMFEEARRKQRQWMLHQEQQQIISNPEKQEDQGYFYQPADAHAVQNASVISPAAAAAAYSNVDVSSMDLNSNRLASPSIDVIDPGVMNNEDLQSTTTSTTASTSAPNSDYDNAKRRSIVSPVLSELTREQIRRHVAPGRAVKPKNDSPPPLVHHRSKEFYTQTQPTPLPALNNNNTILDSSAFVTEVDFPHDSDRFSIHSETIKSPELTNQLQKPFGQNTNRSLPKTAWG